MRSAPPAWRRAADGNRRIPRSRSRIPTRRSRQNRPCRLRPRISMRILSVRCLPSTRRTLRTLRFRHRGFASEAEAPDEVTHRTDSDMDAFLVIFPSAFRSIRWIPGSDRASRLKRSRLFPNCLVADEQHRTVEIDHDLFKPLEVPDSERGSAWPQSSIGYVRRPMTGPVRCRSEGPHRGGLAAVPRLEVDGQCRRVSMRSGSGTEDYGPGTAAKAGDRSYSGPKA